MMFAGLTAFLLCGRPALAGQDAGSIDGHVMRDSGAGVSGVAVVVNETTLTGISDANGRFAFAQVPAGTYSLSLILGENLAGRARTLWSSPTRPRRSRRASTGRRASPIR